MRRLFQAEVDRERKEAEARVRMEREYKQREATEQTRAAARNSRWQELEQRQREGSVTHRELLELGISAAPPPSDLHPRRLANPAATPAPKAAAKAVVNDVVLATSVRSDHGIRPLLSGWLILYPGGGVGGWVRGQKKVCVPKIDLQVRAPLINFIFFLRKNFLMWVGGWVIQNPGGPI